MGTGENNLTERDEYDKSIESLEDIMFLDCKRKINNSNIDDSDIRKIITISLESVQEFSRPLWRLYRETSQNCPSLISILEPKLFLRIIKHIRKIVYQKIENRNVGISIIFFSKVDEVEHRFADYDMQPISIKRDECITDIKTFFEDKKNELKRSYKGVDSKKAFFAFVYDKIKKTLIFKGIRAFGNTTFEKICRDNAVGFNVAEGIPCIRIYHQEELVEDYILSESTGDWVIRIKNDIKNVIKEQVDLLPKDLESLTKIVMQLSYLRIGTILIITSNPEKLEKLKSVATHTLTSLSLEEDLDSELIYQYASNDGAVIIYSESRKRLKAYKLGMVLESQNNYSKYYKELLSNDSCGTRHENAVKYACEHPEDCIIVVSENRSISILHGDKPIYWRDNPKLKKQFKLD